MKDEATDIELELRPIDTDPCAQAGFTEHGAGGFSLLPVPKAPGDDDTALSLTSLESFSFQ